MGRRIAGAVVLGAALLWPLAMPAGAAIHPRSSTYATAYQAYGPTDVVSVTCLTNGVCLAAGEQPSYSMLYRSVDGGSTWVPMPVPGGSLIPSYVYQDQSVAVSCSNPKFCVLEYVSELGDESADLFDVSTNEGLTWTDVDGGVGTTGLTDLTCIGAGTCLGILDGKIASSTDLNSIWLSHDAPNVTGFSCLTARLCYVAQVSSSTGADHLVVSSTTNRGGTLVPLLRVAGTGWNSAPSISCASALACTVATSGSDPLVESTTDGGHTWRSLPAPQSATQHVRALQCVTAKSCTMLATTPQSQAKIVSYSTSDGGAGWQSATVGQLGFPGALPSLWCGASTPSCAAAIGTRSVFVNDDIDSPSASWLATAASVSAPPLNVIACEHGGSGCLALGNGTMATSLDDGQTWAVAPNTALLGDVITSLTCPLATTCIASGHSGTASAPSGLVLLTTDLGESWTSATLPWEVGDVSGAECATAEVCLALPGFVSGLTNVPTFLLRSTDGGLDWSLVQVAAANTGVTLNAVQCPTSSNCVAVGANGTSALVEVSDDAGVTWSMVNAATGGFAGDSAFGGIACTSSADCESSMASTTTPDVYAIGTTNGGSTWSQLGLMTTLQDANYWGASPTMASCISGNCVAFSVNVTGPMRPVNYVTLLASADGGATWEGSDEPFEPAGVDIAVASDGTVIAVGENAEAGPLLVVGTA